MQEKIEEFENNLEGNITSIKIEVIPKYELELVSNIKESDTKEDEVLAIIKENAEIKCKTYAIKLDGNEKAYVNSREEAEAIITETKADVTEGVELNLEIEEQEKNKKDIDAQETSKEIAKLAINKDVEIKVQEYEAEQEALRQEEEVRKAEEAARIAAATRSVNVSARGGSNVYGNAGASIPATGATFIRPVTGGTITSPFGYRTSGYHKGVDIATSTGTPIYAAAGGTVTFSGWNSTGYGYMVIIDHGNGFQTYYAHCSQLYVSAGQTVSQGQNIAAVGSTGNSTGPHVHFQVMYYGTPQNPQNYI